MLARAAQHDGANPARRRSEEGMQARDRRVVERVALVGARQLEDPDVAVGAEGQAGQRVHNVMVYNTIIAEHSSGDALADQSPSMTPDEEQRLLSFWADYLGCDSAQMQEEGCYVVSHGSGLRQYHGAWVCDVGSRIISVPIDRLSDLAFRRNELAGTQPLTEASLAEFFGPDAGAVVGPSYVGYLSAAATLQTGDEQRRVELDDPARSKRLRRHFKRDWAVSGLDDCAVRFGLFDGRRLVAVAGYDVWGSAIAHAVRVHRTRRAPPRIRRRAFIGRREPRAQRRSHSPMANPLRQPALDEDRARPRLRALHEILRRSLPVTTALSTRVTNCSDPRRNDDSTVS